MSSYAEPRDRLVADVRTLLSDTEELLAAVGAESKEKLATLRPRIETSIERARARAAEVQARAMDGARRVDDYASEHPWRTAGVAAGVGAALGALIASLLLSRR